MTTHEGTLVAKMSAGEIVEALNRLGHERLAHDVFQKCFAEAVRSKDVSGLKRSSLFRMTLAYFLLVPDAPAKFLSELQTRLD
jgi:hypothetical protein